MRATEPQLSHGLVGRGERQLSLWNPRHQQWKRANQRRLFHFQEGNVRLHGPERGTGQRAFPQTDRGKAVDWLSVRRLLGRLGHVQRPAATGKLVGKRRGAVGSVEVPTAMTMAGKQPPAQVPLAELLDDLNP